KNCY
ncbi:transcriptional regulator OhrR domain protein, partial [Vibrio parahaemolyticus V-223/04]